VDLSELGAFLRTRRDRIRPADVGLPTGTRRRVPGLRREEIALLAGLSVDYYTELERARAGKSRIQPSAQALASLARALRLSSDERDHLFRLADRPLPPSAHASTTHIQPALLSLLDRLTDTPARIITDLHETLLDNRLATALLGPSPTRHGPAASLVHRWFTDPEARSLYPVEDHPQHSRIFVADLRAAASRRGPDTQVQAIITSLRRHSQEFNELWNTHDVAVRRTDRKRLIHPELGIIELDCHNLLSEDGRQRLLWFTAPPSSPAAAQLQLLTVIGTQDLGPAPVAADRLLGPE
jgi:transcriptional regulator with XRE-family HTH domain